MRAGSWARRPRLKSKKALSAVSRCSLSIGPDFVHRIPASFASHLNSNNDVWLLETRCAGQLDGSEL